MSKTLHQTLLDGDDLNEYIKEIKREINYQWLIVFFTLSMMFIGYAVDKHETERSLKEEINVLKHEAKK